MTAKLKRMIGAILIILFSGSMILAQDFSNEAIKKCSPDLRLILNKEPSQLQKYRNLYKVEANGEIIKYHVLFRFNGAAAPQHVPGVIIQATIGSIATAVASCDGLINLANHPAIEWIEPSRFLSPCLDVSRVSTEADKLYNGNPSYRGDGVLVAIFDSGIDWRHEDFIDNSGKSRILYLWDVTDDAGPHPAGFNYGTEYTQAQINDEIDGSPTGLVRQKDVSGHGTHVAGIAAGDGSATGHGYDAGRYIGIAPQADLIIVKGGADGFSTTDQVNGTAYIMNKAEQLGRPVVINFSLSGHWGAHDGTELHEQAIDGAVGPGKAVVVAAANDGGKPLHASGIVERGKSVTVDFTVKSNVTDFWINLWHEGSDRMSLTITTPDGYTTPARTSGSTDSGVRWDTNSGRIELVAASKNMYNQDYNFIIAVNDDAGKPVAPGNWSFTLTGVQIANGRFDAWTQPWKVEFTSQVDYTMLVGIPGTARRAITVASYCTKKSWTAENGDIIRYTSNPNLWDISDFSSPGPTRDGRRKPELAAPGHGIASARSQDSNPESNKIVEDGLHVIMQGTSMAAPHVAGSIALLLQKNPTLTPEQIKEILINSAWTDSYTGSVWNASWGWGKLDIKAAIDMVEGSVAGTTAQHDIGSVNCGLSDWGAVGKESGADPGFRFPAASQYDHGYGGSLVVGVWAKDVADSYGDLEISDDDTWRTTATGQFRMTAPALNSDQYGYAQFEKYLLAPNGLTHVVVNQHSYAWKTSPYDKFILLDYEIYNLGPIPLNNLLIGFYMDWDCQPNYQTNEAKFDSDLNLAYVWDNGSSGNPCLGTVLLGESPHSFKIIDNSKSVYPQSDLPDDIMFQLMNAPGIMGSIGKADISTLLAAPKKNLSVNQRAAFTIALVAGNNLSEVRQSAARAKEKYDALRARRIAALYYDDGTPEGGASVSIIGERLAVRFTPTIFPAVLKFASFYCRNSNRSLKLNIYDDNGVSGTPGTALLSAPISITPQPNSWNQIDLSNRNLKITSGDFYISLEWTAAEEPSIGYDEEFPHAGRSWYYNLANYRWTNFVDYGDPWDKRDLMIGAGLESSLPIDEPGQNSIPKEYSLAQNYPNPFNSSTTIEYALPEKSWVTIIIYDLLGREVMSLVNEHKEAGSYQINFHANDLASGIYFYRMRAGQFIDVKKMLLIR
ncbi:MAG: S8 family serine peptidase [candidate division KSB1 bacterium]|nr:S8 family serine peptidase [candidate division KSB1 bacterium]MDZ7335954.1 S8 family serine peptidase [candidate division KSB1 bacterium]MDZ7399855.1 S8 family serine peptidase [candidate division KSB1 bacterium]